LEEKKIEVLKNISFNGFYNEIFCILGHNGAGKTTLMNIMIGILSSTQGDVYYDGVPIAGNETEICQQFGYCPQFDTFSNNLSVGEHVKLFAGIKNVKVDVEEILKDIDLLEKEDNFPNEISGGQRRKLCITLALLGSPKFVFLDEPTTGLDPYSRKNIWEVLLKKKKDCIMFVTTHYMDEADLLADRKMIIANGSITCLGSSLFLKNSFNMNYSLDIHINEPKDSEYTDNIIEKYCPGSIKTKKIINSNINVHVNKDIKSAVIDTNVTEDFIASYLLPMKYSKDFKEIFLVLNQFIKDENVGIKNFSLTAPTLEELFIKLENNQGNTDQRDNQNSTTIDVEDNYDELLKILNPIFGQKVPRQSSNFTQILSIVLIRLKIFMRNKVFTFLYILIPICLIIFCIFFENKIVSSADQPVTYQPLKLNPSIYDDMYWFKDANSTGKALDIINEIESLNNGISIESIDYTNEFSGETGKLSSLLNYAGGFKGYDYDEEGLKFYIYHDKRTSFSLPIAINMLNNAIIKSYNIDKKITTTLHPFDSLYYFGFSVFKKKHIYKDEIEIKFNVEGEKMRNSLEPYLIMTIVTVISLSVSIYGPLMVKEKDDGIFYQLLLNGTKRINYWTGILISDSICLFIPLLFIIIIGCIYDISIFNSKIILYPIVGSILWVFISILNQYIFSYYFKKYENASSLFILINPILSLSIGMWILIMAFNLTDKAYKRNRNGDYNNDNDNEDEISFTNINQTSTKFILCLVLFFYSPAIINLLYSNLFAFITIKKLFYPKQTLKEFLSTEIAKEIENDNSLSYLNKRSQLTKAFFSSRSPSLKELLHSEYNFVEILYGIMILLVIYVLILYVMEMFNIKLTKRNTEYTPEERRIRDKKLEEGPTDVLNEWKKVRSALDGNHPNSNIALKVYQINKDFFISIRKMLKIAKKNNNDENKNKNKNIDVDSDKNDKKSVFQKMDDRTILDEKRKIYITRVVDDVSFGVHVGECLGLLGPNGAGKTTCISMITGLSSRTHGKIVFGKNDLNETPACDLSLGYCSQYDALWKLLTVKETIDFYLNICGYPKSDIPKYRTALIEACSIEHCTHKKVCEISGGTRRKLSLIIAICISPNYLILDEPSAGMDPFTRRYMWKLILQLKKIRASSTILTTHSTEEAEALCERIAILIKGRVVCVDTPKSIKMNHNTSYILEVFTDKPNEFEEKYVKSKNLFGLESNESYKLESSISYHKYSVKMKTENIANVFAVMEDAKESGLVSQYNFGQYSLEQVFINFINNSE
jgi:ABC-type multidrug transport system ATPase subunit